MKIAICSDLHLEFGPITLENTENAQVLILSGDICVAADIRTPDPYGIINYDRTQRILDFFSSCSANFAHVVYVLGNHEHYRGHIDLSKSILQEELNLPNLHILENEYVDIQDTRFIGATLWTDMHGGDPLTMEVLRQGMNDFQIGRAHV